ncbi:MAG: Ca-activated chloride channel [Blastocatellia bacterium]|jgi:Ca-activated chloride channel family protein|nr:Ca-activated chloride channel [Blastocatellia bacterium]
MVRSKYQRYFTPALILSALALFFLAAVFLSAPVRAQKLKQLPPPPPGPRYKARPTPTPAPTPEPEYEVIKVSSNLVVVPVSVTNSQGEPVLGLKQTDFHIEEDGRPQEITNLGDPEQVPVDIALLIDVSSSVSARFTFEQKAAAEFLKQVLKSGDRATIFAIDETPRFIQPLTTADVAARKLLTVGPGKSFTAFFDSVLAAQKYLDQASSTGRRRVIVVISDGDDTARINDVFSVQSRQGNLRLSSMDAQLQFIQRGQTEVLGEVQKAEVTFYSINPSGATMHLNVRTARSEKGMERIAQATGGAAFIPRSDGSDLNEIFGRIASEIRSQYLIQYYSNNRSADRTFRRIAVSAPSQPQLRVRAREGYYPKAK